MTPGHLALFERRGLSRSGSWTEQREVVLVLQVDDSVLDQGYEPMALVLHDDGTADWQWVGNLHDIEDATINCQ